MARASTGTTNLTTAWSTIFEAGHSNDGSAPFEITFKHISSTSGIELRLTPTTRNSLQDSTTADEFKLDSDWSEVPIFDRGGIQKVEAKITASGSHELRWVVSGGK